MDKVLTRQVIQIKAYLNKLKQDLDRYDVDHKNRVNEQEDYIRKIFPDMIAVLDREFNAVWEGIKDFDNEQYQAFKIYIFQELSPLLLFPEINSYIYHKPLGYPGDFRMMNYIYDYGDKFLGSSSYEKLVNYYTCQVPICRSNRIRKEYMKATIMKALEGRKSGEIVKIASIASGPAREVLELLSENRLKKPIELTLYDFEQKAFTYIDQELKRIPETNRLNVSVKFVLKNIKELLLTSGVSEIFERQDFIYCIGIFDYLKERAAIRLLTNLSGVLNSGGRLLICNASEKNSSHRAYYELLGDWNLLYRDEEDIIKWSKSLNGIKRSYFESPDELKRYIYYIIEK